MMRTEITNYTASDWLTCMKIQYSEQAVKDTYEYLYGHQDDLEYEYGDDGTVWIHGQGGLTYVKLSPYDLSRFI